MGTMRERQREVQLYRGQIPSPGRAFAAACRRLCIQRSTERTGNALDNAPAEGKLTPLSSGERLGLSSGGFVAPHSADDSVGEVAFVSAPGFASGLALGGLFVDCDAPDWSTKASASATSE